MCEVSSSRLPLAKVFISRSRSIFSNLALEEWLFRKHDLDKHGDVLLLWRNRPAVVIGRHQNPWLEVNLLLVKQMRIDLARRHSGGGTVFHDEGNLNISILTHHRVHCRPRNLSFLSQALNTRFQLQVTPNSRDDMELQPGARKCSGTAARISHGRAYHHLTLLVKPDMDLLKQTLRSPWSDRIQTNATRSTRAAAVGSLAQDDTSATMDNVEETVIKAFSERYELCDTEVVSPDGFCDDVKFERNNLLSWEWIYGKTPRFSFVSPKAVVTVDKGYVVDVSGDWLWETLDAEMITFDAISVVYTLIFFSLIFLITMIFVQRQISRMRNNSVRKEPNVTIGAGLSKSSRRAIEARLESVQQFRRAFLPNITDCETIAEHSNAPYIHRMIAVGEVATEIDRQVEQICLGVSRQPGESTFAFLSRLKSTALQMLPDRLIYRLSYLHESARYSPEKFDVEQLMELRSLLNQFVKILNTNHSRLSEVSSSPSTTSNTLYNKLSLRRYKFGGSDGGRQLANAAREEAVALLQSPRPTHSRTLSDYHAEMALMTTAINQTSFKMPAATTMATTKLPTEKRKEQQKQQSNSKSKAADVSRIVESAWQDLKDFLGFKEMPCFNGGTRNGKGICECPKYYSGKQCENMECLNNGTLTMVPSTPRTYHCKCPFPDFISGRHCERVVCANEGVLDITSSYCRCPNYWYTGRFCENNAASWGMLMALPVLCIIIAIVCCAICRLDLCPRRRSRTSRRERRNAGRERRPLYPPQEGRNLGQQRAERARPLGLPAETVHPPYVIRLDTIPTFNPNMLGGVQPDIKPLEPPPSYEQAITTAPPSSDPPKYTPLPPAPSISPPQPPP